MSITTVHYALGALTNVGEIKQEAHRRAVAYCRGKGGDKFVESAEYAALTGMPQWQVDNAIMRACNITGGHENYFSVWKGCFDNHLVYVKPRPGALQVVELLRKRGVKQAIVSGHSNATTERILDRTKLKGSLCGFVGFDNTLDPPPAPDQYLHAMRHTFGNRDNGVAVVESDCGCEAALEAGLSVIALQDELNRGHQFKGRRRVVASAQMAQPAEFIELVIGL